MKPLKLGGACIVVALLCAMALAVSANASTGSTGSAALTPPSLDPTTRAEVAAVSRLGIPLLRAEEAVAVQSAVERSELINQLQAALGGSFGGAWFRPAAAQLAVGVTSQSAARIAEAVAVRAGLGSSVTEVPVSSSEAELTAAQLEWNRRLAALLARGEASTQASVEDNSVRVELGSAVPTGERAALEGAASEAPVDVVLSTASSPRLGVALQARCREFETKKAFCDPTIVGGTRLENPAGVGCTTGPAVRPPVETTDTYVLTAGHCVKKVGESFFSFNKAGKKEEVGKASAFLNEEEGNNADVAAVKVENAFWKQEGEIPVIPAIAEWKEKAETEPFKVKGEVEPAAKAATCISGQASGFHCGVIKATKLTIGKLEELVEVEGTKTEGGDSGAPWFSEKEKLVQGTHVGENEKTTNPIFEALQFSFKRLTEVSKLELELLSEKNEKREKGTRAFTCVEKEKGDFKDAHCDEAVTAGTGSFAHEEIKAGTETLIDLTNEKTSHETKVTTPALLRSVAGGMAFEIQCANFTGKGTITNKEIEKKAQNVGTNGSGAFTNCTVIRPENAAEERHPCKVKGNEVKLNESLTSITKESLGVTGKEMGVEFKPAAGKPFATFEFEGANCVIKGVKVEVNGTAIGTGNRGSNQATTSSGATLKFTTAMTSETLKVGAAPAEFSTVLTPTMYNETSKTTENPITLTTIQP
jgi:hypothetical protein